MSRQNTISDFPGCHADGARENDRSAIARAAWAMNSLRGVRNRGWLSRPRPLHGASFCPASPIGRTRSLVAAVVDSFTSDAIERERSMSVASEQVSAVGFNCTHCLHCRADSSRRSDVVGA